MNTLLLILLLPMHLKPHTKIEILYIANFTIIASHVFLFCPNLVGFRNSVGVTIPHIPVSLPPRTRQNDNIRTPQRNTEICKKPN